MGASTAAKRAAAASSELRPGEVAAPLPSRFDEGLYFIGRIHTPFRERSECPRQGDPAGPDCDIIVFEPWTAALEGLKPGDRLQLLYFMHLARRDLVRQLPHRAKLAKGTFALRSPVRPNAIASSVVELIDIDGGKLVVRGLDCLDGTPLLDIKPEYCPNA